MNFHLHQEDISNNQFLQLFVKTTNKTGKMIKPIAALHGITGVCKEPCMSGIYTAFS